MNLVRVEPSGANVLRKGDFTIEVPERLVGDLGGHDELVVGFRPEHLDLSQPSRDACAIPATVEVTEYLGDDQLVHLRAGEESIVASIPADQRLAPGEDVRLYVPLEKLHLFDAATDEAIAGGR